MEICDISINLYLNITMEKVLTLIIRNTFPVDKGGLKFSPNLWLTTDDSSPKYNPTFVTAYSGPRWLI